jgi:hypothetical protein
VSDDLVEFGDASPDRRAFLKRLIIGTAFVAPVVASFSMGGIESVFVSTPRSTTLATNTNTTTTTTTSTTVPVTTTTTTVPSANEGTSTNRPKFTG